MKSIHNASETLILIIDDQIENLQILGNILSINKYKKSVATNGFEALEIAERLLPDLILLDIMMPDIDGYETCRRLKENEKTKDIPVIFLTAKTQIEDILEGFKIGGVDYISKPFNHEELLIRIKTHLELKKSKDIILNQNEILEGLIDEKNEILSIAAHDLKNPLQVMMGFAKMIVNNSDSLTTDDIKEFAQDINSAGESMIRIISDLLEINRAEQGTIDLRIEETDIIDFTSYIVDQYRVKAKEKNIQIHFLPDCNDRVISTDTQKYRQILENLVSNAIKFSNFNKNIYIKTDLVRNNGKNYFKLIVEDEGPGIPEQDKEKLFVKFASIGTFPTNNEGSTRLGLAIVKLLAEIMYGKVYCNTEEGKCSEFIVELPCELN